jgi:hypothetical protein
MSFIGPAGFSSIATFYRGTGRPGFVTAVMALVGLVVVGSSALLVPQHGALGAGYAYVLGAVAWLAGLLAGWLQLFGAPSMRRFLRAVGLPLLLAAIAFGLQMTVRSRVGELDWAGLFALGTAFSVSTCVLVVVTDWLLGGESLSKQVAERLSSSGHVGAVRRRIELWQAR